MPKYYIGVDPGKNGGVCVLNPEGAVLLNTKMPDTTKDIFECLKAYGSDCMSKSLTTLSASSHDFDEIRRSQWRSRWCEGVAQSLVHADWREWI